MSASVLDDADGALFALAERVVAANRDAGRTIALAESCTGGMVAAALTDVPGSSDVFAAGFVTYSNDAKASLLGVSGEILDMFGAVSMACTWAMATGAIARTGASIAIAVSGVAGPGGGSATKPVGTVAFSRVRHGEPADAAYSVVHRFDPAADRATIRRQATLVALDLLLPERDALTGCSA